MTAKHRKGKNNHKHEDNFFKNDVLESEVRTGGNNYALLLVLFLIVVIGGATGAWFCFQQHQTLTYLTDNLTGMQMKIVRLQSSHEEFRQTNHKQHNSGTVENRLNALEESYTLAKKQVGMALATAEQLKTSDLPAQVLSLHTEMNTRLSEMQQATVSLEHMSQLQSILKEKSEAFEGVRLQVEGLGALSAELSQKVEILTGSLGQAEAKLDERMGQVSMLTSTMDGQAFEVLRLKEQLATYQSQLEASTLEMAAVRELLQNEPPQEVRPLSTQVDDAQSVEQVNEETAPAAEEEAAAPAPSEEEPSEPEEEVEATAQDEAPAEQEVSVAEDTAPAEEEEQEELPASPVEEEVDTTQMDEEMPEETEVEEEAAEVEEVLEATPAKEEIQTTEEEEEEVVSEKENAVEDSPAEEEHLAAEEEDDETGPEEPLLEEEKEEPQEEEESLSEGEAEESLGEEETVEEGGDEPLEDALLEDE
ncbi:uncharacterized protein LOC143012844 [Genypterus blacodes]|uniref:uncharacterized protein LOC143012844 n=1 Tax=Genypterus blacodes TaxID=154954 RepID=UPI003F75CC3E